MHLVKDSAAHTWDEGEVTTEATTTTEGVMTYTCGDCGKTKTEAIPVIVVITEQQNIALNKDVTVSGTNGDHPGSYITDGVSTTEGTRWESEYNLKEGQGDAAVDNDNEAWFAIDLGEKANLIDKLNINFAFKMWPTKYEVQISNDNTNWTTVKTLSKESGDTTNPTDEIVFDTPVNARYIRVLITEMNANAGSSGIAVYEAEVLGRYIEQAASVASVTNPADITVDQGSEFDETQLPEVQTVTLAITGLDQEVTAQVATIWDLITLDTSVVGTKTVNGILQLNGITKPDDVNAQVNVIVQGDVEEHEHVYGDWTTTKEATCEEAGEQQRTCTVEGCGHVETQEIAATGHAYAEEFTVDKEATCTEAGSKSKHCANCDATTEVTEIPVIDHTYGDWTTTKEATCEEAGEQQRTCTAEGCGHVETQEIAATGHAYAEEFTVDKEATCEEDGSKSKHCANCDSTTEVTVIAATGHAYGEWTTTREASCEEAGEQQRTCTVEGCGHVETQEIEAIGHAWDDGKVTKEPTATEDGEKTYTCTVCGDIKTEVIPATEEEPNEPHTHVYGAWTETKATCTTAGRKVRTCACGEKEVVIIPATGHKMDAGKVTKEPTATTEGTKTYTCSVCKITKTEAIAALGAPKKGTKLVVKGVTYKVTKSALKNGTVTFVSAKKNSKTITVPATIKVDGITYKVTAIEKNAFKNQKKVTKITIGKNVTKIGANAFSGCNKLKNIVIQSSKLTKSGVAKNAFKGIKKSTRITVPKNKVKAYKTIFKSKGLNKKVKVTK